MTTYKATSDQWAYQDHWAKEDGDAACLLELRSRVEQLEANTKQWRTDHLRLANTCASLAPDRLSFFDALLPDDEDSQPTPNSLPIRSSLVERVHSCIVGEPECILELRARVETLEGAAHKHIVETSANILALASRVESLEAAERPASKVYEISKPLKLTAKQQKELNALLQPNSKPTPNPSQIRSSLVERVQAAINDVEFPHSNDEARAAIHEVAMWMTSNPDVYFPPALVFALEQEAER